MASSEKKKTLHSLEELARILPPGAPSIGTGERPRGASSHDGKGKSVRVSLDSKGRKGKVVTIVGGLQHDPRTMEMLARVLKQHCGAGGTVKDGLIEVQGDHRDRVTSSLRSMGYVVK